MSQGIQPSYCTLTPTNQTAIDIFTGLWKSAFPSESGVSAGNVQTFYDGRVAWVNEQIGGLHQRSVLELGPFEAYHTYELSQMGTSHITAVEGNNINYLKCIIVKEILDIRARILHGDILRFLEDTSESYDLCWACGVLYHQVDPLALLKSIAKVCKHIFLWTHFFDDRITDSPERYPHFDPKHNVHKELDGYRCTHYYRSYQFRNKQVPDMFSGGNKPFAYWLSKDDILGYLATLGFTDITIRGINLEHKAGPAFRFLATHPGKVNET